MTVKQLAKLIRTKALAYGVKQELLNDDVLLEEIRKASNDFTIRVKSNLKQSKATTVANQPYYTLPVDFMTPVHLELADFPINPQTLVDFWLYKRNVGV